jgi:hypothetical protein
MENDGRYQTPRQRELHALKVDLLALCRKVNECSERNPRYIDWDSARRETLRREIDALEAAEREMYLQEYLHDPARDAGLV